MNLDCRCPRKKCIRHGNCAECQAFHNDDKKVISFCRWAKITGFSEPESRTALRAWLSNDRSSFNIEKWQK